jgi:hypothetical protein
MNVSSVGPAKWWNPDSVRNFKSGQVRLQPGDWEPLGILIDLDVPDKPVIYLEYQGTPIL